MPTRPPYRGRFAPSPTGPLHFGSLLAAVSSYLQARTQNGSWQVRVEDIDPPREIPGASDQILRTMERFGFEWDGAVIYQSQRLARYDAALERLAQLDHIFRCNCRRKQLIRDAAMGIEGPVYPGTCRAKEVSINEQHAQRVRVYEQRIEFNDLLQGSQSYDLANDFGDFIVRRSDGLHAYQLAVVVDDAEDGITEVVRGSDLLHSTPKQLHLFGLLALPNPPTYLHIPIAINAAGQKLSKQTHAEPLDDATPVPQIHAALVALGQRPLAELKNVTLAEIWRWALDNWSLAAIPESMQLESSQTP